MKLLISDWLADSSSLRVFLNRWMLPELANGA